MRRFLQGVRRLREKLALSGEEDRPQADSAALGNCADIARITPVDLNDINLLPKRTHFQLRVPGIIEKQNQFYRCFT